MTDAQPADHLVAALEAALEYMDECECYYPDGSPDYRSRPGYHPCAHDKARAALPIAREMAEREREQRAVIEDLAYALHGLLPLVTEFEGQTYGPFCGGDPRAFTPDRECCSPAEIAAWMAACAEWERGEGADRGPGCATMGDASAWTGTGLGVGTTTYVVPEADDARAALDRARAAGVEVTGHDG